MGKKRIIKKSTEELLQEREVVESAVRRVAEEAPAQRRSLAAAVAYVSATWNNTIISLANEKGDIFAQSSAGAIGFSGTKKSTPFAASRVAEVVAEKAKGFGISRVAVVVRGIGAGRESAIRSLASHGLELVSIRDKTPIPHNGPRPAKPRRV